MCQVTLHCIGFWAGHILELNDEHRHQREENNFVFPEFPKQKKNTLKNFCWLIESFLILVVISSPKKPKQLC